LKIKLERSERFWLAGKRRFGGANCLSLALLNFKYPRITWRNEMRISRLFKTQAAALMVLTLLLGCVGCASETDQQRQEREQKMRQDAADATARANPALEAAGKELNRAADRAVQDAQAAAEGIREGWSKGEDGRERLNLNAASESDLLTLPGLSRREARLIIENRPYGDKHDLVTKRIITEDKYLRIRDQVVAK